VKSVRKTAGFLSLNWISELVWVSECYEAEAPSNNSSEDDRGFEDKPGCLTCNWTDQQPQVMCQQFVFFRCLW